MKKKEMEDNVVWAVTQINDLQADNTELRQFVRNVANKLRNEACGDLLAMMKAKDQLAATIGLLRGGLEDLRHCCRVNSDLHHQRIMTLETELRQLKCQVETKHRALQYSSCRFSGEDRPDRTKLFTFKCKDCGYAIEKATDELTMKDREALIALGLLEA